MMEWSYLYFAVPPVAALAFAYYASWATGRSAAEIREMRELYEDHAKSMRRNVRDWRKRQESGEDVVDDKPEPVPVHEPPEPEPDKPRSKRRLGRVPHRL